MDSDTMWGIAFTAYILAALPILGMANNGPRPKGSVPGSSAMKQWEKGEGRAQKWLVAWCGGGALLAGTWKLFG